MSDLTGDGVSRLVAIAHWLSLMERSSWLLAAGSAILLMGAAIVLSSGIPNPLVCTFTGFPAVFLHWVAWASLKDAVEDLPFRSLDVHLRWSFWGSILAFVFGLFLVTPLALWGAGGYWALPWILLLGLFPFIPTVFAPVVVAHAALFGGCGVILRNGTARGLVAIGAGYLAVLATAAFGVQLLRPSLAGSPGLFLSLSAGLTAVGYLAFAVGLRVERHRLKPTLGPDAEPGATGVLPS